MSETDLVVVGGGPAGCAAAVMASSLGMRSVLLEPGRLCAKLDTVSHTANVLGGFTSGRELAERIRGDVARARHCEVRLGATATEVRAAADRVTVTTAEGGECHAGYAVVATGVRPQTTTDAGWIDHDRAPDLRPLWEADLAAWHGHEVVVLGADRPLGTVLRARADLDVRVLVVCPAADGYKADEIRDDRRVTLLPADRLDLRHEPDGALRLVITHDEAAGRDQREVVSRDVYLNLGNRPAVPAGDLRLDDRGYCPPERQHPRILVAGDLRGARYQRIMTAFGSGAEAALTAYYAMNDVG